MAEQQKKRGFFSSLFNRIASFFRRRRKKNVVTPADTPSNITETTALNRESDNNVASEALNKPRHHITQGVNRQNIAEKPYSTPPSSSVKHVPSSIVATQNQPITPIQLQAQAPTTAQHIAHQEAVHRYEPNAVSSKQPKEQQNIPQLQELQAKLNKEVAAKITPKKLHESEHNTNQVESLSTQLSEKPSETQRPKPPTPTTPTSSLMKAQNAGITSELLSQVRQNLKPPPTTSTQEHDHSSLLAASSTILDSGPTNPTSSLLEKEDTHKVTQTTTTVDPTKPPPKPPRHQPRVKSSQQSNEIQENIAQIPPTSDAPPKLNETASPSSLKKPVANLDGAELEPTTKAFASTRQNIDKFVKTATQDYKPKTLKEVEKMITDANDNIQKSLKELTSSNSIEDSIQDLTKMIGKIDEITDLKIGIVSTTHDNKIPHVGSTEPSSVVFRDARDQFTLQEEAKNNRTSLIVSNKSETPEATIAIIASQARGILRLVALDSTINEKEKATMQQEILKHFKDCSTTIGGFGSPKDHANRANIVNKFSNSIADLLKSSTLEINGLKVSELSQKELSKAMAYSRDFANFEAQDSSTIITVTSNIAKDETKPLYEVTTSVPLKPVGGKLEGYYQNLPEQSWFKNLTPIEQALVEKYKDQILDGKHLIPTSLREVVGIKNGYLEQSSVINTNGESQGSAILIRSATLAHNLGSSAPGTESITEKSMRYINELSENSGLVIDTLNHDLGSIPSALSADMKMERNIVKKMKEGAAFLKAQGEEVKFYNNPISFAWNKTKNIIGTSSLYMDCNSNTNDQNETLCVSCKSGKDRTGIECNECTMNWMQDKFGPLLSKSANASIAYAAHQEELASQNTKGIYALKAKTIFTGMRQNPILGKIANVAKLGDHYIQPIADLNAVKLKKTPKSRIFATSTKTIRSV